VYIGIDVGGTNLVAGVVDESHQIVARAKQKTGQSPTAESLCDALVALSRQAVENAGLTPEQVDYVGIGFPGSVDRKKGTVLFTPNAPFLNTPIRDWFHKSWDVPVYVGNDANCASLGECYAGAARGKHSAVVVTLGTGVGIGAVVEGQSFLGLNGNGMEGGHMVIVTDGEPCNCGRRGCWEQYSSATALKRLTRKIMDHNPRSSMWQLCEGSLDKVGGRTAFQAARAGDPAGKQVVDLYLKYLATGLANLVNIFQPEVLCLGGGVSNEADDLFLDPLRELVARERYNTHQKDEPQTMLLKCQLGNDAGIIGAALLGRVQVREGRC
jgi:glucokinase